MSNPSTTALGDVQPARSRHAGRRSAVCLHDQGVAVGTADGRLQVYDTDLSERWMDAAVDGSVVRLLSFDGGILVGERGADGRVALYDRNGTRRWSHNTAGIVGEPVKESRFFLPFIVAATSAGDRVIVASRRYERDGEKRRFESAICAFEPDGRIAWTYEVDASPIALAADRGRVAVAYNRCPGDHQHGLVVLDGDTGEPDWMWDPGTDGGRRVGDVVFDGEDIIVASHGDYRGYRLSESGSQQWQVDLARPEAVDGETVYAYPNHCDVVAGESVFVTGNTYPENGRETEARHPREHAAIGVADRAVEWETPVEGFAGSVGTDGERLAVPVAQHFRDRDATVHGCRVIEGDGRLTQLDAPGVVTDVAVNGSTVAFVEEPVVYHDEGTRHGTYRLHYRA